MNKYQHFVLNCGDAVRIAVAADNNPTKLFRIVDCIKEDQLEITQCENYNIKKHNVYITGNKFSYVDMDGHRFEKEDVPSSLAKQGYDQYFIIPIDFDKRAKCITMHVEDDLVDPITLGLLYVEADKSIYDQKIAEQTKQTRIETAKIRVSTGADLVNIYFQPCCDEYVRTEIVLYKDKMMIAKYKIDEESFFKSIGGLAYGKYTFVLRQLDKDYNALFETEHIEFAIGSSKPHGVTPRL